MSDSMAMPVTGADWLWSALMYIFIWKLFILVLEKAGILQKSK